MMNARKTCQTVLTLVFLSILLLLPACDGTPTPLPQTATPSVVKTAVLTNATPAAITIKQELEEQLAMLRALVDAEKGRGNDVSQVEQRLDEADQALQVDDLILAREKLRDAGEALGVKLP